MLIVSTYAWFKYDWEPPNIGGIKVDFADWDVEYSIDNAEIKDEEITFAIDEFYPGMDEFTKNVVIRNKTPTDSSIILEVTSVKLFGEEIVDTLKTTDNITEREDEKGVTIFSTENYPFKAGYYWDKNEIGGIYVSDETTPDSTATVTIFANWSYTRTTATKSEADNDDLDTTYGMDAYKYYQDEGNDEPALLITIKLSTGRKGLAH
ncbi:MAG: hypothetical protein IKL55_05670 [Clostridia bacterium]|nr:hypothetical protein [Clostridia bacterium]